MRRVNCKSTNSKLKLPVGATENPGRPTFKIFKEGGKLPNFWLKVSPRLKLNKPEGNLAPKE